MSPDPTPPDSLQSRYLDSFDRDSSSNPEWTRPSTFSQSNSQEPDQPWERHRSTNVFEPGTSIGDYQLIEHLGQGGMGIVYKAKDSAGNLVAIKSIRQERRGQKKYDIRLEKEIRSLIRCRHPNVLRLIDLPRYQGHPFLVTEYVEGKDLHDWVLGTAPLTFSTACDLFIGLLEGLDAIHREGIVHRDIKPSNILLRINSADAEICEATGVIADFGLSRFCQQNESMHVTRVDSPIGTPPFMPPEQFLGRPVVDPRGDLFALGVTFYFSLTGQTPLDCGAMAEYQHRYADPDFCWERVLFDSIGNTALRAFFQKALALTPEQRFQSASWMAEELKRCREGRPSRLLSLKPLPQHRAERRKELSFCWELKSNADQVWKYLADTNEVNRFLGLPAPEYNDETKSPDRVDQQSRSSSAETTTTGMKKASVPSPIGKLSWMEFPFEWNVRHFHQVLREFDRGPFHWIQSRVELEPLQGDDGYRLQLKQHFTYECPNRLCEWLANVHLRWHIRPRLEKLYRQIDRFAVNLDGPSGSNCPPPFSTIRNSTNLQIQLQRYYSKLLKFGADPSAANHLLNYLGKQSDSELGSVRPLEFGKQHPVDNPTAITTCLAAVQAGLLLMRWAVICPVCRVEAKSANRLSDVQAHFECDYCQHRGPIDFATQMELLFEVTPSLIQRDRQTYCIGGPYHLPHVVVQRIVPANSVLNVVLSLPRGSYQIGGPQFPVALQWNVVDNQDSDYFADIDLENLAATSTVETTWDRPQVLLLSNPTAEDLLVRIEKSESAVPRLLLERVLKHAEFAARFPEQLTASHQLVIANQRFLLLLALNEQLPFKELLEHQRLAHRCIATHEGEVLFKENSLRCVAAFERVEDLQDAVVAIRKLLSLKVVLMEENLFSAIAGTNLVHHVPQLESVEGVVRHEMKLDDVLLVGKIQEQLLPDRSAADPVFSCRIRKSEIGPERPPWTILSPPAS